MKDARLKTLGLLSLLAAVAGCTRAFACDPNDANCQPVSADACASFTDPASHALCVTALPACTGLSGPPLQACLAHGVLVAQNSATGTGTSTGTATSTGSSTSTSTNRAIGYQATITNTSLYDAAVNSNSQSGSYTVQIDPTGTAMQITDGGGTQLNQRDAYNAQGNMLLGCTQTSLTGRTDAGCAGNPNLPECTGMSAALGNATTCAKPGPPDKNGNPTCLAYGAFGYNLDEWLVFGQQFFNGMTGCFAVGDKADTTGTNPDPNLLNTRADRLAGLGSFAAFPPAVPGPSPSATTASTVTGSSANSPQTSGQPTPVAPWQAVAAQSTDGATYLGLDNGTLVQAAATGQSFLSVFNDSPFAAQLADGPRSSAQAALSDPAETIAQAKEKEATQAAASGAGEADPAGMAAATAATGAPSSAANSGAPAAPNSVAAASAANPRPGADVTGAARAAAKGDPLFRESAAAATPAAAASAAARGLASANPQPAAAPSADALADARALLGGTPAKGAKDAFLSSPEFGSPDSSLFERVTLSYRRITPKLKAFDESKTARDVRNTEEPAFFKNL